MVKELQTKNRHPHGYNFALTWLIENDDCDWVAPLVRDPQCGEAPSVAACLVMDIYRRTEQQLIGDLYRELQKGNRI
jgi:hypothetical protein